MMLRARPVTKTTTAVWVLGRYGFRLRPTTRGLPVPGKSALLGPSRPRGRVIIGAEKIPIRGFPLSCLRAGLRSKFDSVARHLRERILRLSPGDGGKSRAAYASAPR